MNKFKFFISYALFSLFLISQLNAIKIKEFYLPDDKRLKVGGCIVVQDRLSPDALSHLTPESRREVLRNPYAVLPSILLPRREEIEINTFSFHHPNNYVSLENLRTALLPGPGSLQVYVYGSYLGQNTLPELSPHWYHASINLSQESLEDSFTLMQWFDSLDVRFGGSSSNNMHLFQSRGFPTGH